MKKIFELLFIALLVISCGDIDNFDAPNCTISGQIIDAETGEPFQARIGDASLVVRAYEINPQYPNPQEYNMPIMQDGTFRSTGFFASTYKLLPYSIPAIVNDEDAVEVSTSPGKPGQAILKCIPYLRIKLEVEENMLYFTITKPAQVTFSGNLMSITIMRGSTPLLNDANCFPDDATRISYSPEDKDFSQAALLGKRIAVPMEKFVNPLETERIQPGEYYFRVCAAITNAVPNANNFSAAVKGIYTGPKK